MNDMLQTENIDKSFGSLRAVQGVSLTLAAGEFVAIMGRSGSGKTTLLHLLAGLESPTSGRILFQGRDISRLNEDQLALWRREHVGLVFQAFHLIPTLSAVENVAFPLYPLPKCPRKNAAARLWRAWNRWDWASEPDTGRANSAVASSSAWRSRAP